MALDAWFPLAIYYEDLDGAQHNPALAARIRELFGASGPRRTGAAASWTGDVHNVDRLHLDPAFDWLTDQVGRHALNYLGTLGHDLDKTDIYVQRAWPVVAQRGQRVARHAHHTAHVSAVYYVAAPRGDAGGAIRFVNEALPNEVSAGIGSSMTSGYSEPNALNYGGASYRPIAGRLLLFPAKQPHEVEPNETDEERISISYDLVITSRDTPDQGHHEFLMPPPALWKKIGGREPEVAPPPLATSLPEGRWPLAKVSRFGSDADGFTIPDREGHVLWEPTVLAHCSSKAAWGGYAARLAGIPPQEWRRDPSGTISLWQGCRDWPVCQDAVDRLYVHLRNRDIPLDGANVTAPVLQKRLNGVIAPHERGVAHLCVYLRIDYSDANYCALEFAQGGSIELPPGAMAVFGGARRHRLRGASHVIALQLDIPAIARAGALQLPPLHAPDVADHLVFAALVAQPVSLALPSSDALLHKIGWLEARARKRDRHRACPAVRRLLLEHADPASASATELEIIRRYGIAKPSPQSDGRLIEDVTALSGGQCETLCRFADSHMTSIVPDTVDDLPEYQVDLSIEDLTALLGRDTVTTLLKLPERLGAPAGLATEELYDRIHIFLRMYSPQTRPYIAFHADTCAYTVNIALNNDNGFDGGRLLALQGSTLTAPSRRVGTAILHAGTLVHGVTKIERGTRYSLILFFHRKANASAEFPGAVESIAAPTADFVNVR